MVRAAPPDTVLRLVEDPEFRYEDFAPRGEQSPPTMRAQVLTSGPKARGGGGCLYRWINGGCSQDYSWEDHGFSLVNRLLPDMGQFLDEKFQVIWTWLPPATRWSASICFNICLLS